MLFISGSDDPIGNFGKGIQQTVSDLEQDGFKDITMKLYTGMRHEILMKPINILFTTILSTGLKNIFKSYPRSPFEKSFE